jgi:hypothetical protein
MTAITPDCENSTPTRHGSETSPRHHVTAVSPFASGFVITAFASCRRRFDRQTGKGVNVVHRRACTTAMNTPCRIDASRGRRSANTLVMLVETD